MISCCSVAVHVRCFAPPVLRSSFPSPVSGEYLVRYKFHRDPLSLTIRLRLPVRERIRLREEVRHELIVVVDPFPVHAYRGLGLAETNEVSWGYAALVEELIEGVLTVCAGLPEVELTGGEGQLVAVDVHALGGEDGGGGGRVRGVVGGLSTRTGGVWIEKPQDSLLAAVWQTGV